MAVCCDMLSVARGAGAARVKSLGFRPPGFVLDAELQWVLQRALGPLSWQPTSPVCGQRSVNIALRLDVAARIAARQPRPRLEQELGPAASQRLREQYVATVAREALLEHALNALIERARAADVPCVLLKYAALSRMGVLRVGSRVAGDIDVLVPQTSATRFQAELVRNGYKEVSFQESAHQLPILQDPTGSLVELHLHLPGVSLGPAQPFATADDLISAGLTRQLGNALVPDPVIVTAHAIAHGLVQHARAPHSYSALKAFADLADLGQAGFGAFERAGDFLKAAMTEADLMSALTLARALQQGDLATAMLGPTGVLLRHALAGRLDRGYSIRLFARMLTQPGPTSVHLTTGRLVFALREVWNWACSSENPQR